MTSSAEGWGLTLTESLQRGVVPVVMNSSPVFSEIIETGRVVSSLRIMITKHLPMPFEN